MVLQSDRDRKNIVRMFSHVSPGMFSSRWGGRFVPRY
jgi:hypothetical protein